MFVNASPLPKQEREHYFNKNDSITEPTSSFHKRVPARFVRKYNTYVI